MTKRKIVLLFITLLVYSSIFAETMAISTVVVYDQDYSRFECETDFGNIIYKRLEKEWFSGLIAFSSLSVSDYGEVYTVLDANKVCTSWNFDYILYGFVQKNENSWYGNIKLYSLTARKIEKEFFASDEVSHIQRFMNTLCENIISGIYEITGLHVSDEKPSDIIPFRIDIPAEVFYWNPLGTKWNEVYTGIVGGLSGIDFVPPQKRLILFERIIYFSLGADISYCFGIGKENSYPLNLHTIQLLTPAKIHVDFNERHSLYAKVAPYYEIDLLNISEKYKTAELHFQNMAGLEIGLGYEFSALDFFSLYAKTDFDFHFSKDGFFSIKPGFGAKVKVYSGELK